MVSLTQGEKPIALTENGPVPDPDRLMESGAKWLWFMPWWGGIATDGKRTSREHLRKVYDHPYSVTHDELPDLKNY